MEKAFGLGVMVTQYRDPEKGVMQPAQVIWGGKGKLSCAQGGVDVSKAEEFYHELGKAIKFAKQANIKTGTKGR